MWWATDIYLHRYNAKQPNWKNLHRLSERLASLHRMEDHLKAQLKPLNTIVFWFSRVFKWSFFVDFFCSGCRVSVSSIFESNQIWDGNFSNRNLGYLPIKAARSIVLWLRVLSNVVLIWPCGDECLSAGDCLKEITQCVFPSQTVKTKLVCPKGVRLST